MSDHQAAVRGSASWAAWGDALGFITELTDAAGVRRRSGLDVVHEPVAWRRRVGGRMGVDAKLPAGAYSDDTQLRLATGRAIRGDGDFDVEAFAKVELPAWQSYALGAGKGSKAAAAGLTRQDAHWNQNTFTNRDATYTSIGGNGAAMRIQPHVWAARDLNDIPRLINRVVRDSVCTHGSPVGIVGAVVHALTLTSTLRFGELPRPTEWLKVAEMLRQIPEVIGGDEELAGVWVHAWELAARAPFQPALAEAIDHARAMGRALAEAAQAEGGRTPSRYTELLEEFGGLDPSTRGSGIVTAWMAAFSVHTHPKPADALRLVANTLGSDTDTIATMAGALVGAVEAVPAPGPVQDAEFIDSEAKRLHLVSKGVAAASFRYPDLMTWNPPRSALDLVGIADGGSLALAGHGVLSELSEALTSGRKESPMLYRWARTPLGQHVFFRHRLEPAKLDRRLLPPSQPWSAASEPPRQTVDGRDQRQGTLFSGEADAPAPLASAAGPELSLDAALRRILQCGFDPSVIGTTFLELLESRGDRGRDEAVALAGLIAHEHKTRGKGPGRGLGNTAR